MLKLTSCIQYHIYVCMTCMHENLCHDYNDWFLVSYLLHSITHPQAQRRLKLTTLSLMHNSWNTHVLSSLVSISAICKKLGTCWIFICFTLTLSCTKWMLSSMCFVRAWRVGLCEKRIALRFSHQSVGGKKVTLSSLSKDSSHKSSEVMWVKVQYFASMVERAINDCFFELWVIIFEPAKIYDPNVEWKSWWSLAQLKSL